MKLYCVEVDGQKLYASWEFISSLVWTHHLWSQGMNYESVVYDKTKRICEAIDERVVKVEVDEAAIREARLSPCGETFS